MRPGEIHIPAILKHHRRRDMSVRRHNLVAAQVIDHRIRVCQTFLNFFDQ